MVKSGQTEYFAAASLRLCETGYESPPLSIRQHEKKPVPAAHADEIANERIKTNLKIDSVDSRHDYMPRLLVRNLEPIIVERLKERARLHGVAVEEEHRRILREVCLQPFQATSLIDFSRDPANAASPSVELPLERSRETESRQLNL